MGHQRTTFTVKARWTRSDSQLILWIRPRQFCRKSWQTWTRTKLRIRLSARSIRLRILVFATQTSCHCSSRDSMHRLPTLPRWPLLGQGKKHLVGWTAQSCRPLNNNKESVKATLHFPWRVATAARIKWWATGEVTMATVLAGRWCRLGSQLPMTILAQTEFNKQETPDRSAKVKRQVWSRRTQTNSIVVCEAVWVHRISSSRWCLEVIKAYNKQHTNSIVIKPAFTVKTLNNHKTKLKSNSSNH